MPREDTQVPDQPKAPPPALTGGGAPGIDSILSQMMRLTTDTSATDKALANIETARQGLTTALNQPKPQMPPAIDIPARPRTNNVDIMQAFAQPAAIMAIFGSLLTRRPMTAAITAAAAAMQGYAQGNAEAAKRAEDQWRDNLDVALKQNQIEVDRYRAAIDAHRDDVNAALAEITAASSEFHDEVALQNAKAGNLGAIAQILDARARMGEAAQNHRDMMQLRQDQLEALKEHRAATELHAKVQEDLGKEKLGLLQGKTADTVKAKASELQSLSDQIAEIEKIVTEHPEYVGAVGLGTRLYGSTVGQVIPSQQQKGAAELKSKIETLQTRLNKPFLGAHYFTGQALEQLETLVPGLGALDDQTTTLTALEQVKGLIDSQVGAISSAASDVVTDSSNLLTPGIEVIQNGWRYRNENGTMVPIGPEGSE